jgi:hypothetical protein
MPEKGTRREDRIGQRSWALQCRLWEWWVCVHPHRVKGGLTTLSIIHSKESDMTKKNSTPVAVSDFAINFSDEPTIENLRLVGDAICEQGSGYRLDQVSYTVEDMLKRCSDCGDRLTDGWVLRRITQALQFEAIGKAIYREEQNKKEAAVLTLAAAEAIVKAAKK